MKGADDKLRNHRPAVAGTEPGTPNHDDHSQHVHRNYACGRHHGRDDLDCDDSGTGCDLEVKIDNFTFAPQRVTVKAVTTVTWINEHDILHTVASSTETFKSKALDTNDKFRSARLPSCSESR